MTTQYNISKIEDLFAQLTLKQNKLIYKLQHLDNEYQNKRNRLETEIEFTSDALKTLQDSIQQLQSINDEPCGNCSNLNKGIQWCMKSGCLEGTTKGIQYPLFESINNPPKQIINDLIVQELTQPIIQEITKQLSSKPKQKPISLRELLTPQHIKTEINKTNYTEEEINKMKSEIINAPKRNQKSCKRHNTEATLTETERR
jgi:hypothetical protein